MTPDSIAGLTIPEAQLEELIQALAALEDDNVVPLHPDADQQEAA